MKSLFRVYESLLGDMEAALDKGSFDMETQLAADYYKDGESSLLNKFFNIVGYYDEKNNPFKLDNTAFGKTLEIYPDKYVSRASILPDGDGSKLSSIISDLDCIWCKKQLSIIANNTDIDYTRLAKTIAAPYLSFEGVKSLSDIELFTNVPDAKDMKVIKFDNALESLNNVEINMDPTSRTNSMIWFNHIPEFNNVKSNSVTDIIINYGSAKSGVKPWSEKVYDKLFDFGYTLKYVAKDEATVKVNNIAALKKLVTAKDFYNRIYTEWPVKIKSGVKMSDILDISQFTKLGKIIINDGKMGITFEKTERVDKPTHILYVNEILKTRYNSTSNTETKQKIFDSAPTTADGWKVYVIRL